MGREGPNHECSRVLELTRAAALGERLRGRLLDLQDRHEVVGDVRGRGLLHGIELVRDEETREPADGLGETITAECVERGLHPSIVRLPGMGGIFRIAPPLTIIEGDLDTSLHILEGSMRAVLAAGVHASAG